MMRQEGSDQHYCTKVVTGSCSWCADSTQQSSSLRHPHVNLRDTIAMKLIAVLDPFGQRLTSQLREQIGEIVDDLVEYIRNIEVT